MALPARIDSFSGEYAFLSNFYFSRMEVHFPHYGDRNKIRWRTIKAKTLEHAYQASKTLFSDQQDKVLYLKTPGQAKKMGRRVTLRPDWETLKVSVMISLVKLKYEDWHLRKLLLETHPAILIEGNTWGDTFWGVCKGRGENILGKILMEHRYKLRLESLR